MIYLSTVVIILVTIIYARGKTMNAFYKNFAAEYNCAAYGAGSYNSNEACETTTDGGALADTGTNVAVGITGGVLLIAVAAVILITSRRKAKKAAK